MSDALDRIRARVEAHVAAAPPFPPPAAPVQPPAEPVAPPQDDLAQQVADLNDLVAGLADRVSVLEGAAVDDAMDDLNAWADPGAMASLPDPHTAAVLPVAQQDDLPDSDFAYIEPGGAKDDTGKTTPRSLRHFPIQDADHVRDALSRAPQSPFGDKAMPAIEAAAKKFKIDQPAPA